jgi:ribosomal protein L30/L7E
VHAHHSTSLVIIFIVHIIGILAKKSKCNPPVSTHRDGPTPLALTFQGMEIQPGQIHIARSGGRVQLSQDQAKSVHMLRLDSRFTPRLKELTQTFMPEPSDHATNCNLLRYGIQVDNPAWEILTPSRTGTGLEATGPGSTLYKEGCGIERLAPERWGLIPNAHTFNEQWSLQACSFAFPGGGLVDPLLRALPHPPPPRGTETRSLPVARAFRLLTLFLGGSGQGCPLLRASNEHIRIVRVLRARRAPGHSLSPFRFRSPQKGCRGRRRSERAQAFLTPG